MKVLYVVSGQSFFSSDPGRKRIAMVRCWRRLGYEVMLICGGDTLPSSRKRYVQKGDAKLAHPPWYRRLRILAPIVNSVSEVLNVQHDRRLARMVEKAIEEFQPDIYWQRSSRLDGKTFARARQAGVITVLEWKDHLLSKYGASLLKPYAAWVERQKELTADFIVVESNVLKQQLSRNWPRSPDTVFVAYNAIDPADFVEKDALRSRSDTRQTLGIPDKDYLVAYTGTFNPWYHRVELLVEALKFTSQANGRMIHLLLIGDGVGRPTVENLVRKMNVEKQVHFTGLVPYDEVPHLLAASDAAALPDCTDIITPIKVLEYMAMELPTLLPDYVVNQEVVEDNVSGLLFKNGNAENLGARLMQLLRDPSLGRQIGQTARQTVLDRFVWKSTWGRVLEDIGKRALGHV